MAVIIKALKQGQVAGTGFTDTYSPPNGRAAIVKSMRLVNAGTSAVTLNTWFVRTIAGTPTSYRILPKDLVLAPGQMLVDDSEITMENFTAGGVTTTDLIQLQVSVANVLYYVFSGIERDQS